ncbi:hypothetical protein HKX48_007082 [Thoreauomyces humboldtii]|nr:hypothetical protein HKX48_007082 [Thoreauomyces humboldtii]
MVMDPLDEVPARPRATLSIAMVAVLNALAVIGCLMTIACMVGLVVFRRDPVVASASMVFSLIIALGILIGHCSVFTHVNIGANKPGLTATIWLMASGFILSFAAMFVKTHRIYKIFNSKVRLNVSQPVLLARTMAICSVVWLYIILWLAIDPIREELVAVGDSDWVRGTGDHFQTLGFGLIGLILVFLVALSYMSFQTRNVWQRYNETLYIGYSAYIVTFSAIIILPLLAFLSTPPVVDTLSCLMVEMSLYTMLIAVIGTKFWMIYQAKNIEDGAIFSGTGSAAANGPESGDAMQSAELKCRTCHQTLDNDSKKTGGTSQFGASSVQRRTNNAQTRSKSFAASGTAASPAIVKTTNVLREE